MSRESSAQIDRGAGTVARLRSRAVVKPLPQASFDLLIAGVGMTSPEILTHQIDAGLKQVERLTERVTGCAECRSHIGLSLAAYLVQPHRRPKRLSGRDTSSGTMRLLYGFPGRPATIRRQTALADPDALLAQLE